MQHSLHMLLRVAEMWHMDTWGAVHAGQPIDVCNLALECGQKAQHHSDHSEDSGQGQAKNAAVF